MKTVPRVRRRARAPLARLLLLAPLAACAAAPESGPGSAPDVRDPGPDFGFIPNAIGIVQPGRTYLETAIELERGPESGEREQLVTLLGRRGVAENTELRVTANPLQSERDADGRTTGVGPLQLGLKHRVSRGEGRALAPAWGFEFELLLPTGNGAFDGGKLEPGAWVNVDHPLSETGVFTWNAGFNAPVDADGAQFLQAYLAWAYAQFVTKDLQLYVTGSWNPPAHDHSGSLGALGVGLYWTLSSRAVLIAGTNAGLGPDAPDLLTTLGVTFAF